MHQPQRNSPPDELEGSFALSWEGRRCRGEAPLAILKFVDGALWKRHRGSPWKVWQVLEGQDPLTAIDQFLAAWELWPVQEASRYVALLAFSYELGAFTLPWPGAKAPLHKSLAHFPLYWIGIYDSATWGEIKVTPGRGPAQSMPRRFEARSNFTAATYGEAVTRIQDYIRAGDVYQVNLAQRFVLPWNEGGDAGDFFSHLASNHAAPYSATLSLSPSTTIFSFSPERFLRLEKNTLRTEPIKGTVARAADPAEDEAQKGWLRSSAKNRAELAMIVDLERNDLGKICVPGSIRAAAEPLLKSFPAVHHLVGSIEGMLLPQLPLSEILRATFPGGSITGAPKMRAMEIISELEKLPRGIFTGALGFLDGPSGVLDLNVAIRTFMRHGTELYLPAGAGIVAESEPTEEFAESLAKIAPLLALAGDYVAKSQV